MTIEKCTWVDCQNPAAHPIKANDGEVWANLCDEHNAEIDRCIVEGDAKGLLRAWVRAGGGAKKMVRRLF